MPDGQIAGGRITTELLAKLYPLLGGADVPVS